MMTITATKNFERFDRSGVGLSEHSGEKMEATGADGAVLLGHSAGSAATPTTQEVGRE